MSLRNFYILTNRLSYLSNEGFVDSIIHPDSKKRKLYYLTELGKSLFPVLGSIVAWKLNSIPANHIPSHLTLIAEGKLVQAERQTRDALTKWENQYLTQN